MIYTRGGDKGQTSLASGERVPKYSERVECYGTLDELSACLAVVADSLQDAGVAEEIMRIENALFNIEGIVACGDSEMAKRMPSVENADVKWLEDRIDGMNEALPPLKAFIIYGGCLCASHIHVARAVCRRAERLLVRLNEEKPLPDATLSYINRLSDYLFVLARTVTLRSGGKEVFWQGKNCDKTR